MSVRKARGGPGPALLGPAAGPAVPAPALLGQASASFLAAAVRPLLGPSIAPRAPLSGLEKRNPVEIEIMNNNSQIFLERLDILFLDFFQSRTKKALS